MNKYKVRSLDAKYDETEGMLVINCLFEHSGERKIVIFSKKDISQSMFHREDIGDSNMHYFARCMAKRQSPFSLVVEDDPNRKILDETELMKYGAMFNKRIGEELESVSEGIAEERGQMQRKLGRMKEEGKIKELNALDLLKNEQIVRGKLC